MSSIWICSLQKGQTIIANFRKFKNPIGYAEKFTRILLLLCSAPPTHVKCSNRRKTTKNVCKETYKVHSADGLSYAHEYFAKQFKLNIITLRIHIRPKIKYKLHIRKHLEYGWFAVRRDDARVMEHERPKRRTRSGRFAILL